jgi:glycosyltransferase involved in cell wall biosynthesis
MTDQSSRRSILIVAPWVYHDKCGIGGGVQCYHTLRHLAEHYEIHWISFDHTVNDLAGGKRALSEICRSVQTIPLPHRRFKVLWMHQLLGGPPVYAEFNRSKELRTAIQTTVTQRKIDLLLCQFTSMSQYVDAAPGVPAVIDTQDVWSVSRFRAWQQATGLQRWNKALTWWAWARYEFQHYRKASLLVAVSEADRGVLQGFVPEVPCILAPVATDVTSTPHAGGHHFLMVGNYEHAPNLDGLNWLLSEVWPLVRARYPQVVLKIVGPKCPEQTPSDTAQGVEKLGFVNDLDPLYNEAIAALVPYRFGGGTKIKTIEAMGRGCPVVATPVGAEGLTATSSLNMLIAQRPDQFGDAIVELIENPLKAREIGETGRQHVDRHYSFRAKISTLLPAFDGLMAK